MTIPVLGAFHEDVTVQFGPKPRELFSLYSLPLEYTLELAVVVDSANVIRGPFDEA
jgi:hypothetical protein